VSTAIRVGKVHLQYTSVARIVRQKRSRLHPLLAGGERQRAEG